jgi:hypothetical protein
MKTSMFVAGAVSVVVLSLLACSKDEPPPATPIAQPAMTGTPPPGATAYPAQPGYQQPGYQPAPTASVQPGQMAVPGPTALACQNDGQCMSHRCNMQYQKCAFPCVSDNDCIQGTTCFVAAGPAAFCMPKPPGSP